ncbi:MAG: DUF1569 domain-containing protein [Ignavibacteriales bacterium]|nr:DUF1569 domain-containing protein [Ignavibacteriales bacterium]
MKNIFDPTVTTEIISRINKLDAGTKRQWGKMNAAQMLAHCNVTYELVYDKIHPKPNTLKSFILKIFVKPVVVGEKPYKKDSPTAPEFKVNDDKIFETEKGRLINYILKTQELGAAKFHNKESHSFGALTKDEWNNLFYKHLDHHLNQFGV